MNLFALTTGCLLVLGVYKTDGQTMLNDAELWFFNGDNFDMHVVYPQINAANILRDPSFNALWPTVLYIHGLNESPMEISVQVVINAYLSRGGYNTLLLNWQTLADAFYPISVANVARLGTQMASVLNTMFDAGLELDTFHLVGHSLGGQMSGYIGTNIQSMTSNSRVLPRISALDPAGPLYYPPIGTRHITPSDAVFVDIIHTDAGFLGAPEVTGSVDFWPNSGRRPQPGCAQGITFPLSQDDRCSHSRSWRFWAESVLSTNPNTFLAVRAVDWRTFQNGNVDQSNIVQMGLNCPTNATGNYYLQTNSISPFSRGTDGLHYQ